jgi:DNA-directed RNA polymerase specialized sigma24 family protein
VEQIYNLNSEYASLEPPPAEAQMLIAALQGNADDTSRFMGTMTGAVGVAEFYAAENLARILGQDRRRTGAATT